MKILEIIAEKYELQRAKYKNLEQKAMIFKVKCSQDRLNNTLDKKCK